MKNRPSAELLWVAVNTLRMESLREIPGLKLIMVIEWLAEQAEIQQKIDAEQYVI